jgi:hypothetical protein
MTTRVSNSVLNVPGPWAFKNAVMNGAFEVWQRGTSFPAIAINAFSADRWQWALFNSTAVHTLSRSTDVPTVAQAGVLAPYSLLVDCTTADAAVAAADIVVVSHKIEGYVWRRFAQRELTISFWVKATKTGVHCVCLNNSGTDRAITLEYTINVTNTWEKKTINIPASPSAGTWDYTTGIGVQLLFVLMAGSNYQGSAGSWQASSTIRATTNQVNACDSTSNDFRLALVQLEPGNVATAFEDVPYEVELMRSMRYYERYSGSIPHDWYVPGAGYFHYVSVYHKTKKRISAAPSFSNLTWGTISGITGGYPQLSSSSDNGFVSVAQSSGSGRVYAFNTAGYVECDAEL